MRQLLGFATLGVLLVFRAPAVNATSAPGAPIGLSVSAMGSVVTMTWQPPDSGDPPSGYVVEAGSAPGLTNLANVPTGSALTTFSRSGVAAGTYFVRVRAANAAGAGPPSNEAVLLVGLGPCTPPGTPALALTRSHGGGVGFSWTVPTGAPITYVLEAGSAAGRADRKNVDLGRASTMFSATGWTAGPYYVRVRARNACGTGAPSNEIAFAPVPDLVIPATFFGINDRSTNGRWPPRDSNGQLLPIAATRLWDSFTCWGDLEPANGMFVWTRLDTLLANAEANEMDVELTFGGTPGWAGGRSGTPCSTTDARTDPPNDINPDGTGTDAQWLALVRAVVAHCKGRVKYYSVWNEQNSTNYWRGTPAQMARMAYDLYQVVHGANGDPNARVLTPSMTGGLASEAAGFTSYFGVRTGPGANPAQYSDVIVFHGRSAGDLNARPESVVNLIDGIRAVFANYPALIGKPLWMDEGGWRPNEVPDVDMQAAYVARYYLLQASAGIARAYWYGWDNINGWGTLFLNGVPTRAATAYTQVATWLVGSSFVTPCVQDALTGNWSCELLEADGRRALAIWNPDGEATYVPSEHYVRYRDLLGGISSIGGSPWPITIGPQPLLLESNP